MRETRAAIRRLRIYAIILVALTIWGATEPRRDTVCELLSEQLRTHFKTGEPR